MPQVWFIHGTSRGIGLGFLSALAGQPGAVVYASARNPTQSQELQAIAKAHSNVRLLAADSTDEASIKAAAQKIKDEEGKVDVVVVNAGYGDMAYADKASAESIRRLWEINALGPLLVFQAFKPLQSHAGAKFTVISSAAGSFNTVLPFHSQFPMAGYASSKAAANMLLKSIHFENPEVAVAALHPGTVQTDMSDLAREVLGASKESMPTISVDESVKGMLKVIDTLKVGAENLQFLDWEGNKVPY